MSANFKERAVLIRSGLGVVAAALGLIALGGTSAAFAQGALTCTGNGKISKQIAKQMIAAQEAQKAKKWQEELAKVREAEAVPGPKTQTDLFYMSEFRAYAYTQLRETAEAARELENALNSPCMPEARKVERLRNLVGMYSSLRNFPKAIEFGNRALRISRDADTQIAVAQAYYQSGNNKEAVRVMNEMMAGLEQKGQVPKEQQLLLVRAACEKVNDNSCVTRLYEKLVVLYPKPEYWQNLLVALKRGDTNDKQKINVLRLAVAVDVLKRPEEYTEMAQIALDEGLPGEAEAVLSKAFEKGLFKEKRDVDLNKRLLAKAKTVVGTEKAKLPQQEAAARATPTGDDDVKVGAAYLSYGDPAKAVEAIKRGIAQGKLVQPDEASILLGIAYLKSDNKTEAAKAFRSVKQDPTMARIAKLWLLNT